MEHESKVNELMRKMNHEDDEVVVGEKKEANEKVPVRAMAKKAVTIAKIETADGPERLASSFKKSTSVKTVKFVTSSETPQKVAVDQQGYRIEPVTMAIQTKTKGVDEEEES